MEYRGKHPVCALMPSDNTYSLRSRYFLSRFTLVCFCILDIVSWWYALNIRRINSIKFDVCSIYFFIYSSFLTQLTLKITVPQKNQSFPPPCNKLCVKRFTALWEGDVVTQLQLKVNSFACSWEKQKRGKVDEELIIWPAFYSTGFVEAHAPEKIPFDPNSVNWNRWRSEGNVWFNTVEL